MELEITTTAKVPVKYLRAICGVRYWEDADVNGVNDESGDMIPHRSGDVWDITIDLESGVIQDWPSGTTASVHYKVCDDGRYVLLSEDGKPVRTRDWYVPPMLAPKGNGYGDYVILEIDGSGKIDEWRADLSYFEGDDDD